MGIHSMEEGRRRFSASNHRHMMDNKNTYSKTERRIDLRCYDFPGNMLIYNGNHENEAGNHFGNLALLIGNGS